MADDNNELIGKLKSQNPVGGRPEFLTTVS